MEIIEEVRRVAKDPEVAKAVAATTAAAQANSLDLQNLTKLADKIGVVNLGNIETQNNTSLNNLAALYAYMHRFADDDVRGY